jgi:hypothetical protein
MHAVLGGAVVRVLATGPNVRGFKPSENDGFLRTLKILRRGSKAIDRMS